MFRITTPNTEEQLKAYFHFRWQCLRKPWNFPEGSEKDEYEGVSEHRMILDGQGNIIACGRVHLNTSEEAQIRHIAVHQNYHRRGLGNMILTTLEQVAAEQGAIRAVTNSRETSVEFFSQFGYETEGEASKDLGLLNRRQMVKKLSFSNSLVLHPIWCGELQTTWKENIPIIEHMGIKINKYCGKTLETHASLNKNINMHGTMFAGSIFSLASLTGWGMIYLQLKERKLNGDIVLGDGDIHYHKPITSKPVAICHVEALVGKFTPLEKGKKARFQLQVNILDGENPVAEFKGVFWVLPEE